jgi:hypothetical protein
MYLFILCILFDGFELENTESPMDEDGDVESTIGGNRARAGKMSCRLAIVGILV